MDTVARGTNTGIGFSRAASAGICRRGGPFLLPRLGDLPPRVALSFEEFKGRGGEGPRALVLGCPAGERPT